MATTTETSSAAFTDAVDNFIDLPDVRWSGYRTVLQIRGDRPSPRILYLDGSLTFVSPSMPHEYVSHRLGLVVHEVTLALGRLYFAVGHTTLGREVLDCGAEGDQAFYLANFERIRGKTELDLEIDPPPDLIVEVVVSHSAKQAMEIYRRLGVPELWVCTQKRLRFFRLGDDGAYHESQTSIAFPLLDSNELFDWVTQPPILSDSEWTLRFRDWIRDELLPRAQGGGHPGGA